MIFRIKSITLGPFSFTGRLNNLFYEHRIIDVLFFFCSEDVFLLLLNIEDNFMLVGFALVIISGQSKQKCRLLRFKKKS